MSVLATGMLSSCTAIPQTQNTAPVLEFRCLYTSDIRRKQKRWQDGRLKFHTFNKRIMVYDERSNFVADSHWREEHALEEGEELEMDRSGIIVQVCDFVGTREQDLTALLNRAVNVKQRPVQLVGVSPAPPRPSGLDNRIQEVNPNRVESSPASAKRRKVNSYPSSSNGYAQNLTGATLSLSGARSNNAPVHNSPQPILSSDSLVKTSYKSHGGGESVVCNIAKTKLDSQLKRLPKGLAQTRLDSRHSEKITGAALVLTNRTPTSYRLPQLPRPTEVATPPPDRNDPTPTTSEDHEFLDIDLYDKKGSSPGETFESSSEVTRSDKNERDKLFLPPTREEAQYVNNQPERSANPLRIKTRPKKKLLLAAALSSRPSTLTSVCVGSEISGITTTEIINKLDPFNVALTKVTQATESTPSVNQGSRLSPPAAIGIDHHGIDKILTRKGSGDTGTAKTQHQNKPALLKAIHSIQPGIEMEGVTGPKRKLSILPSHVLNLQSERDHGDSEGNRQSIMSLSNTEKRVAGGHTSHSIIPGSPPPSRQPSDRTLAIIAEDNEAVGPARRSSRILAVARDVIPFKSPVDLNRIKSQSSTIKARKDGKHSSNDENGALSLAINIEPSFSGSKAKMTDKTVVANSDQGPWTREAFDLFDWRPNPDTVSDCLEAG